MIAHELTTDEFRCVECGAKEGEYHRTGCIRLSANVFVKKAKTPEDNINHPKHYTSHKSGIECIQITEHMSFNIGNVIKYLWRADEKGAPIDDLRKARWYLDREIKKRGGE